MSAVPIITVYTANGCPHCAAVVTDLRRRGVRFAEVNLSRQPERVRELEARSWERRVPVIVDHERVSVGFGGASSTFGEVGLENGV